MTTLEITYNGCEHTEHAFIQFISYSVKEDGETVEAIDSLFTVQKYANEIKFNKAYNLSLLSKVIEVRDKVRAKYLDKDENLKISIEGLTDIGTSELIEELLNK